MTQTSGGVPHALATAYRNLIAALDEGIQQFQASLHYSNSHVVCRCIERFVDALRELPGGQEELQRRATWLETHCGPGSEYAIARERSLPSYRGQPQRRSASKFSIEGLRKSNSVPLFMDEVVRVRQQVEHVLNDGILNLSDTAKAAYESWRSSCRAVQRDAEHLEVDGCRFLMHIHESAEDNPSKGAAIDKVIIQTDMGGAHLASIKVAAESLLAWARENATTASYAASLDCEAARSNSPTATEASPSGFLGGAELAELLGVHADRRKSFFRQLERQRLSLGDDCWHEVRDPRPNSPRFLYRVDSTKLRELAARYKTPTQA